jgi:flagellar motor protein MotB
VAFSTYEPNPYRLLGAAGRKAASQIVIGTIPREEGGRFEFRDEEYKASYHVVNVLVGRTSQPEPASPEYVALAEAALKGDEQQAARLADVQQEISDRHLSASPEKWDSALAPGLAPPRPARAVRRPLQTALAGALIVMAAAGGFWVGGRTPVETQRQLASARKEIAQLRQSPATPTAELEFAQRLQQALQIGGVKPRVEDAVVLAEFEAGLFGEGTEVSAKGNAVLAEVRKTLSPLQEQLIVEVEGHTDSRTVRKGAAWTDNYMLGYLRARVVEDGLRAGDGLSKAQFRRSSVGPDSPVLGSRPADAVNRSVLLRLQKKR